MGILELDKNLKTLNENSNSLGDLLIKLTTENNIDLNMNSTHTNNTIPVIPTPTSEDIYYHKNNLSLLLVLTLAFFVLCYYLYYISKYFIKKAKSVNAESNILLMKYNNLQNLSIANFVRGLSTVYIIISFNKNGEDIISFINYFVHIFPSILYFSVYLTYVRFLIEKYYEIKTKKSDIFFSPTMQFFNILVYVVMIIITFSCLMMENYMDFQYMGMAFISLLSLITSMLYLYYGVRLANIYSNGKEGGEIQEKKYIHNRILFISLVVGVILLLKALLCFFISINMFHNTYPTFMEANAWDFTNFLLSEFFLSLIIGYTRHKEEKGKNGDKFNLESFDFNKNYQNFPGLVREDLDKDRDNPFAQDLNDPLLDKFDKP